MKESSSNTSMPDKPHEIIELQDIVSDPYNSRIHTPRSVGSIVDSIQAAGLGRGIVIDEENVALAGNGTVEAALEAIGPDGRVIVVEQEPDTIVAVRRRGLTEAQQVRLALDDNRSHEHSSFDPEILEQQKAFVLAEIPIERWDPMWKPVAIDIAPIQPAAAAVVPNTAPSLHSQRKLLIVFGKYRFELTAGEDEQLDALITRWIEVFGSVAGCGSALASALGEVVGDGNS